MDVLLGRRREGCRYACESARILLDDTSVRSVDCCDISSSGASFISPQPLQLGKQCMLSLDLAGRRINAWAVIVFCIRDEICGFRIGVEFLDMDAASKMIVEDWQPPVP